MSDRWAGRGGRMNWSAWALRHRAVTLYVMLAVYMSLGRAEDPPFTIKQMIVEVDWPGASADEMAQEVTDRIERKLEELPSIDYTESATQPGRAIITVSLRDDTPPANVSNLWYEVRKKIGDIQGTFPAGVRGPYFNDEFGDVFGILYGFTGDGFSLPQLKHVLEDVREQLLSVPGVGKVQIFGEQDERIYVDFSYRKLAELGLDAQAVFDVIRRENGVVAGGFSDTKHDRVFVRTGTGIDGPAMLAKLPIGVHGHLVPLSDLATITRGTGGPSGIDLPRERAAGARARHLDGQRRQHPRPWPPDRPAHGRNRTDPAARRQRSKGQRSARGRGEGCR